MKKGSSGIYKTGHENGCYLLLLGKRKLQKFQISRGSLFRCRHPISAAAQSFKIKYAPRALIRGNMVTY